LESTRAEKALSSSAEKIIEGMWNFSSIHLPHNPVPFPSPVRIYVESCVVIGEVDEYKAEPFTTRSPR